MNALAHYQTALYPFCATTYIYRGIIIDIVARGYSSVDPRPEHEGLSTEYRECYIYAIMQLAASLSTTLACADRFYRK